MGSLASTVAIHHEEGSSACARFCQLRAGALRRCLLRYPGASITLTLAAMREAIMGSRDTDHDARPLRR